MFDKLIEGRLLTLLVGSVFRLVEIFVRTIHIGVRAVRLLIQELLTSPIDARISTFGKRRLANRTEVDESSVLFIAQHGEYTGDPKYIAEEILRRSAPYKITWVLREDSVGPFPQEFRFVRAGTALSFRAIARAKVVIQDGYALQESGAVKGSSQIWIQTGDAVFAMKPREKTGIRNTDPRWHQLGSPQMDLVLTSSPYEDEIVAASSWPHVPTLMVGHARNDILINTPRQLAQEMRKKVLDRFDIVDVGQRFVLYTPSHVDVPGANSVSGIDLVAVREALSEKFGGIWDILIRTHDCGEPSAGALAGLPVYCHSVASYPDMQELLVVADAYIGDGSLWMRDYLLTRKPTFPYSTGIDTSNQDLLHAIDQFDQSTHDRTVTQMREMDGNTDDGYAASRTVDKIESLMSSSVFHREHRP